MADIDKRAILWSDGTNKKLRYTVTDSATGDPIVWSDALFSITDDLGNAALIEKTVASPDVSLPGGGVIELDLKPSDAATLGNVARDYVFDVIGVVSVSLRRLPVQKPRILRLETTVTPAP